MLTQREPFLMTPTVRLTWDRLTDAIAEAIRGGADHAVVGIARDNADRLLNGVPPSAYWVDQTRAEYARYANYYLAWATKYESVRGHDYAAIHLANAVLCESVSDAYAGLRRMMQEPDLTDHNGMMTIVVNNMPA